MTIPTSRSSTRLTTDPSILNSEAEPERPPLSTRVLARRVDEVPRSGIRRFFDILATMTDDVQIFTGASPPLLPDASTLLPSGRAR